MENMGNNGTNENTRELSIYVHIPFCIRKCNYCDFLSAPQNEETRERYGKALLLEIEYQSAFYKNRSIDSIFFGGGTPSVMSGEWLARLLGKIRECFLVEADAEISIEVNPGTVDAKKLEQCHRAGFNRISIGLQSAVDTELQELGRVHDLQDFLQTVKSCRAVGFANLNVDIMSAIPGQTRESYQKTLDQVLAVKPEHISAYSLIVEEGTDFYERRDSLQLPDEDQERALYEMTGSVLKEYGYYRYEISNYAKPGYECRHNSGYWRRHAYLGLGIGAASLDQHMRWKGRDDLFAYLEEMENQNGKGEKQDIQHLSREEEMEEFMFLGLRMMEGVHPDSFQQEFGCTLEETYGNVLKKLLSEKLMKVNESGYLSLTDRGIDISNTVMAEFLF